jgi:nicotinamidase/pyrazinamidase
MNQTGLLIVDVQNDFCPGGALPVENGDRVVPVLNRYARAIDGAGGAVFASRDWHPPETLHFNTGGGPWPPHCVQGTKGAAFRPDLDLPGSTVIVTKGDTPRDDGYSAFDGHDAAGHDLASLLDERNINRLLVGGLATDYCVRASVLDAVANGVDTVLLLDAIRGIDLEEGDVARAIDEMLRAGATTATLATAGLDADPGQAR